VAPGSVHQLTWGGSLSRTVARGESFWSDTASLALPSGHYCAFTWTVEKQTSADAIPYAYENQYSCFTNSGFSAFQESNAGFSSTGDYAVAPNAVAYKKSVKRIIGIIGNSITQGFNASMNSYAFWVAQAALNLGPDYGVWNLGSGWAQSRDAATNSAWLGKVKCCDDAVVCLGVNDIRNGATADQVLGRISTVVSSLLQISPTKRIILCTVPPFNFAGASETQWRAVNAAIRANPPSGVAHVFDLAALLGQNPPNDNLANPAYGDGHPNDSGGKVVGKAFASFYLGTIPPPLPVPPITLVWNQNFQSLGSSRAHSICQASDQGFFAVGSLQQSGGIPNSLLLKTDNSGALTGSKQFWNGNSAAFDCCSSLDHGVIVAGFTTDSMGDENIGVAKFDSTGNEIFHECFGAAGSNRAYCLAQSPDSGFFVAGYTASVNPGDTDIMVLKIDKNGNLLFANSFGRTGWDCCYALSSTKDGGCMITGGTFSYSENGGKDVFLAKLDATGSVAWKKIYGGNDDDISYNVTSTYDGGFAIVGGTASLGGVRKAFLLKTDSLGNYQWHRSFGGTYSDAAYGVAQMPDSGFLIAANMPSYSADSAATLIKTNACGDSLGIVKFKGIVEPGGSPLRDAGSGKKVFCYTAASEGDTSMSIVLVGGF
jgi:hypothetical protein